MEKRAGCSLAEVNASLPLIISQVTTHVLQSGSKSFNSP